MRINKPKFTPGRLVGFLFIAFLCSFHLGNLIPSPVRAWYSIRGSHYPPTSQIWGKIHCFVLCAMFRSSIRSLLLRWGIWTMIRSFRQPFLLPSSSLSSLHCLTSLLRYSHDWPLLTCHCIGPPAIDQRRYLVFITDDLAPISEVFSSSSRLCFKPHFNFVSLLAVGMSLFTSSRVTQRISSSVGSTSYQSAVHPQASRPRHLG